MIEIIWSIIISATILSLVYFAYYAGIMMVMKDENEKLIYNSKNNQEVKIGFYVVVGLILFLPFLFHILFH